MGTLTGIPFCRMKSCCDLFVPNRPFRGIVMDCTILIRIRNIMMRFISLLGITGSQKGADGLNGAIIWRDCLQ